MIRAKKPVIINLLTRRAITDSIIINTPVIIIFPERPSLKSTNKNEKYTSAEPVSF